VARIAKRVKENSHLNRDILKKVKSKYLGVGTRRQRWSCRGGRGGTDRVNSKNWPQVDRPTSGGSFGRRGGGRGKEGSVEKSTKRYRRKNGGPLGERRNDALEAQKKRKRDGEVLDSARGS